MIFYYLMKWKPSREVILGFIAFVVTASIVVSLLKEVDPPF